MTKKIFYFKKIVFFVIIIAAFFGGFFYGKNFEGKNQNLNFNQIKENESIERITSKEPPEDRFLDFSIFWETWKVLEENFYNKEKLDPKEMIYGAIKGMVKAAGDPYTEFFKPKEAQKFLEDIQGEFGGIGAEIGKEKNKLKIIAPLKDSPAERAGLKPGDIIVAVNGSSTLDFSLYEAVKKIRGKVGTKVVLTILREGWEKPKDFEIVRELIQIPCLEEKIEKVNGYKIIHLSLYNFNQNLRDIFYKKAFGMIFENPDGIILDLRNNTGGYLDVAVDVASWFLKRKEVVVKEVFSDGKTNVFRSKREGPFSEIPMVVLINQGTASAAEILAGALRDQRQIPLVGKKTFGKGSVQQIKYLSDGSFLKVTVALWELPSGKIIQNKGLLPDYEVENKEKIEKDFQLEKAKEILLKEIEKKKPFKLENYLKKIKFEIIQ